MKLIAITAALLVAGIGIVPARNQQAVVQQEPASNVETVAGYEVLERINDTDVCILIDGVPVWVTLDDEFDTPEMDWEQFDAMEAERDG